MQVNGNRSYCRSKSTQCTAGRSQHTVLQVEVNTAYRRSKATQLHKTVIVRYCKKKWSVNFKEKMDEVCKISYSVFFSLSAREPQTISAGTWSSSYATRPSSKPCTERPSMQAIDSTSINTGYRPIIITLPPANSPLYGILWPWDFEGYKF